MGVGDFTDQQMTSVDDSAGLAAPHQFHGKFK
jgi:hypothetical protein